MNETLREEVDRYRGEMKSRGSRRISAEQHALGQRLAVGLCESGLSLHAAEEALGVSDTTISRWLSSSAGRGEESGCWLPVVVSSPSTAVERSASRLVLHSSQGWWLDGLSLDDVADLLARRA